MWLLFHTFGKSIFLEVQLMEIGTCTGRGAGDVLELPEIRNRRGLVPSDLVRLTHHRLMIHACATTSQAAREGALRDANDPP